MFCKSGKWGYEEFLEIISDEEYDRMYDEEYFVSLVFYMGLLTIERQERTRMFLKIPNYVIKTRIKLCFDLYG